MRKLVLIIHTSLDGFVAGPNGELSWFPRGEENLEFVAGISQQSDAALLGRKSFQLLDEYWPAAKDKPGASKGEIAYSEWYNKAEKFVLSKTLQPGQSNINIISNNVPGEISSIKQRSGKNILIFGSPTVARYLMQYDLIDSYWIFINPVLFGKGLSPFPESDKRTYFRLMTIKEFANGEVAMLFDTEHR